jgi:hypothetical protein
MVALPGKKLNFTTASHFLCYKKNFMQEPSELPKEDEVNFQTVFTTKNGLLICTNRKLNELLPKK